MYFTVGQLIVEVELLRATEDIFGDDSCQIRLDAKEFLSEVGVLDFRQAFGPLVEMRWQRKLLLVPYECPNVMEGVVGILRTARRLLDAGELCYVSEHVCAYLTTSFLKVPLDL